MSPRSRVAFWAVTLLFLASRLYILFWADVRESTLAEVNVLYALSFQQALREGTSFYAEVENLEHRLEERHEFKNPTPRREVEYRVEYPPLAIEWMRAPLWLQRSPKPGDELNEMMEKAVFMNRAAMACVDLAGFVMLALLAPRLFRGEGTTRQSLRLLLYVAGGMILLNLLYDRLDLPVGILVLAAVALLVERRHWALSFAVLAVVINYKLTPAILSPVWILAAVPTALLAGPLTRDRVARLAGAVLTRAFALAAFVVAIFLPFYLSWGDATLDFLEYHARRGLQIESLWAAAVLVLGRIHPPQPHIVSNFGAVHLDSRLSHALAGISPWVAIMLFALATLSFWRAVRRRLERIKPGSATVAQAAPDLIVGYTVLFLLVGIASSKVLSPQYFVWLVPLVPLLAWDGILSRAVPVVYLLLIGLTTVIFPYAYETQIVPTYTVGQEILRVPPTTLGLAVLVARGLLLAGVTACLWLHLRRQTQP